MSVSAQERDEEEPWIIKLKAERRLLQNYRGRRLEACRAIDKLCDVIDHLGRGGRLTASRPGCWLQPSPLQRSETGT